MYMKYHRKLQFNDGCQRLGDIPVLYSYPRVRILGEETSSLVTGFTNYRIQG